MEEGDCLDGMFRCKGHRDQKARWRRRKGNCGVALSKGAPAIEEDMEEWEKEEMAAMWKFQGQCDAARMMQGNQSSHFDRGRS